MARPLAEFEPTEEAVRLAVESWSRYLETGVPTQGQLKAVFARPSATLAESFGPK